jgi:ribosomal protein S18 acetylase RimI-like enzyme
MANYSFHPGSLSKETFPDQITLRPVSPADLPFLIQVYASTRDEEIAIVPWSPDQKRAFIEMQYNAQSIYYKKAYPGAETSVILLGSMRIGRLIVNRTPQEILLMDIALLPGHRNSGIGTGLLRSLIEEARQTQKVLRLHVETFNPAIRLYQRLGFFAVAQMGIYLEMEWKPSGNSCWSEENPLHE